MKVVFIAAPYSGETEHEVANHILAAYRVAEKVWSLGAVAICPHTNSAFMEDGPLFLLGYHEVVKRCDALLAPLDFSPGTNEEIKIAREVGIPVFTSLTELEEWLDETARLEQSPTHQSNLPG